MDQGDIQHYIAAREAPPPWRRPPGWPRWLRPRRRFSLSVLLAVVTGCCVAFAFMNKAREYPRLEFRRFYSRWPVQRHAHGRYVTVFEQRAEDEICVWYNARESERYVDYVPLGTLDNSDAAGGWTYAQQNNRQQAVLQRRYQQLRAIVSKHIDLNVPAGVEIPRQKWLLSPDFPTLEEYIAKAEASESPEQLRPSPPPREYPCLLFYRESSRLRVAPGKIIQWTHDRIGVAFGPNSGEHYEDYTDYKPFGTLNEVKTLAGADGPAIHYQDWMHDGIPPLVQRRYQELRALVSKHIDLDAAGLVDIPSQKWLLPPDFPTLEEYITEAEARESAKQNTPGDE